MPGLAARRRTFVHLRGDFQSPGEENLHGARGLHGLVWEWVDDFNTAMVTGESRADTDRDQSLFCGGASATASDTSDYAAFMRQALRSSLTARQGTSTLGFRCAADAGAEGDAKAGEAR